MWGFAECGRSRWFIRYICFGCYLREKCFYFEDIEFEGFFRSVVLIGRELLLLFFIEEDGGIECL